MNNSPCTNVGWCNQWCWAKRADGGKFFFRTSASYNLQHHSNKSSVLSSHPGHTHYQGHSRSHMSAPTSNKQRIWLLQTSLTDISTSKGKIEINYQECQGPIQRKHFRDISSDKLTPKTVHFTALTKYHSKGIETTAVCLASSSANNRVDNQRIS